MLHEHVALDANGCDESGGYSGGNRPAVCTKLYIEPAVILRANRMDHATNRGHTNISRLALGEEKFFQTLNLPESPSADELIVAYRHVHQGYVFKHAIL